MTSLFTIALFSGGLYYVLRFQNYRWRLIAQYYGDDAPRSPTAAKRFATVVAFGGLPLFTRYVGVTIAVCGDGLSLRMIPPFSIAAPPLFLPFEEMTIQRTSWYLNSGSFLIRMTRGDCFELIIDDDVMSWLQANSDKCELWLQG
jgi:hypothetical protein